MVSLQFHLQIARGYLSLEVSNNKPSGQGVLGMQRRGKIVQICQYLESHWSRIGKPPKFRAQRDSGLSVTLKIKIFVKGLRRPEVKTLPVKRTFPNPPSFCKYQEVEIPFIPL